MADFADDVPGLMKSAIGQENVTATALQMALVAGTVANGGVEMTPHLMEQIHDTQGNLVTTYTPKKWMQPISAQTAATLTTFMQGVVASGTAKASSRPAGTWPPRRGRPRPVRSGPTRVHRRLDDRLRPGRQHQGGRRRGASQPAGQRHRRRLLRARRPPDPR